MKYVQDTINCALGGALGGHLLREGYVLVGVVFLVVFLFLRTVGLYFDRRESHN